MAASEALAGGWTAAGTMVWKNLSESGSNVTTTGCSEHCSFVARAVLYLLPDGCCVGMTLLEKACPCAEELNGKRESPCGAETAGA